MATGALKRRVLLLCAELLSVLDVFETAGIPAVPFKGPTLAALLYHDPAARAFLDLDLLVHRRDAARARGLLTERGYRPAAPLTPGRQAALLATAGQMRLVRADGCIVELHTAFGPTSLPAPVLAAEVWDRLQPVPLAGRVLATLATEDLLLLLAYHGAKHLWLRLEWLRDVARLLNAAGTLDWEEVTRRARIRGAERMLLLALHLASELLDAPVPGHLAERARNDRAVQWLASRARRRMVATGASWPPEPEIHIFRVRALERPRDRARYLWHASTTPTPADWEAVALPDRAYSLYYLVRPIRLVAKYAHVTLRSAFSHPT